MPLKLIAAAIAILMAGLLQVPVAQAGCNKGGSHAAYHPKPHKKQFSKAVRKPQSVARRASTADQVAAAEPASEKQLQSAEKSEDSKDEVAVAAHTPESCSRFIPEIGKSVTVECD